MLRFLDGEYDPVTHAWGFLDVPFAAATSFFDTWMMEIRKANGRSFEGTIREALAVLGKANKGRVLLASTASPWIAVFCDRKDAFHSEVGHPSQAIPCRGINLLWAPHTYDKASRTGEFGAVAFESLAANPTEFLNIERNVGVWADTPGWEFEQTGTQLPFEKTDQYRARLVRERFPPELLGAYCEHYGIRPFEPAFYGPTFRVYEPGRCSVVAA
jgi:hypothetical protein